MDLSTITFTGDTFVNVCPKCGSTELYGHILIEDETGEFCERDVIYLSDLNYGIKCQKTQEMTCPDCIADATRQ